MNSTCARFGACVTTPSVVAPKSWQLRESITLPTRNDGDLLKEILPAPGSDLYYALLYAPTAARPSLTLIESFRGLISAIPGQCSSPDVASQKLAWWHEEIHRLGTPDARHAVTRALGPVAAAHQNMMTASLNLIDGTARLLSHGRFAATTERAANFAAIHGPLWRIHAEVCGEDQIAALTGAGELGTAIELNRALRDLRRHIGAGLAWVCHDCEPAIGAQPNDADWYAALAALEAPVLSAALERACGALATTASKPRRLRSLYALAALTRATLQEIAADGYRVWEHRIELTPLRKLWLAWTARSAT